jgi:hypothetical protein
MTCSATTTIRKLFPHVVVGTLVLSSAAAIARGQDSTMRHSSAVAPVRPVPHDDAGTKVVKKGTLANANLMRDAKNRGSWQSGSDGLHNIGRRGHEPSA